MRKASEEDYVRFQGGVPSVEKGDDGLWRIRHGYRDDKPEVVTHKDPKDRGTVNIGGVEYEVAKLWRFEGGPCEGRSRSVGGEGYLRRGERKG